MSKILFDSRYPYPGQLCYKQTKLKSPQGLQRNLDNIYLVFHKKKQQIQQTKIEYRKLMSLSLNYGFLLVLHRP